MNKSFSVILIMLISACSSIPEAGEGSYPLPPEEQRRAKNGRLTGDGIKLFKMGDSSDDGGAVSGIAINSYLWRATLDVLSFMPLASADPFGGVIITDRYEDSANKGVRFKVNAIITSRNLRSDAIKVNVFKQVYTNGSWRDTKANAAVSTEFEDKILTRAREIRIKKESVK